MVLVIFFNCSYLIESPPIVLSRLYLCSVCQAYLSDCLVNVQITYTKTKIMWESVQFTRTLWGDTSVEQHASYLWGCRSPLIKTQLCGLGLPVGFFLLALCIRGWTSHIICLESEHPPPLLWKLKFLNGFFKKSILAKDNVFKWG